MRTPRRLIVSKAFLRPSIAFVLYLCAWATFPPAYAGQNAPSDPQSFSAMTRRAIARGRAAEAESLAKQRPAGDPAAAAVLGQLAIVRGQYTEATSILEPAAQRDPGGEAALQLGLLLQQLGQAQAATRLLSQVLDRGSNGPDGDALFRAARAAHALGRPRDANTLYRAANGASADPAIDAAWGLLFLEKYNKPEALRSLQEAHQGRAGVGAGARRHRRACWRTRIRRPPPRRPRRRSRSTRSSPTPICCSRSSISTTPRYDDARASESTACWRSTRRISMRGRWLAAIAYVRDDPAAFDAEVKRVLAINPGLRRGLPRRRAISPRATTASTRRWRWPGARWRSIPANTRAYGDLGMHLMRTGDEPEARARARARRSRPIPFDQRHLQPAGAARHARQVRRRDGAAI